MALLRPRLAVVVLVALALCGFPGPSVGCQAESDISLAQAGPTPAQVIEDVLEDPEFATEHEVRRWRFRWEGSDEEEATDPETWNLPGLVFLGPVLEVLMWVAAGLVLFVLLFRLLRSSEPVAFDADTIAPTASVAFGLDVRQESLPDDVGAAARRLVAEGRITEALSLLYRASLSRLVQSFGLQIQPSWTEAECLRHAGAGLDEPRARFMTRLTDLWCLDAYGHRAPLAGDVLELSEEFAEHFSVASAPAPPRSSDAAGEVRETNP